MRVRHWRLSEIDNDSTERQPTEWCIMAIVVLRLMHIIHILHIFRATNGPTCDLYSLLCSCNPVHSGMLKYDFSNMCLRVCAPPKKSQRDWWFLVIMMRLHAGEPHVFRTTNDNSYQDWYPCTSHSASKCLPMFLLLMSIGRHNYPAVGLQLLQRSVNMITIAKPSQRMFWVCEWLDVWFFVLIKMDGHIWDTFFME